MRYLTLLTLLVSLTLSAYAQQDWTISFNMNGTNEYYVVTYYDSSGKQQGWIYFDTSGTPYSYGMLSEKTYKYFSKYFADDPLFCREATWFCIRNYDNASALNWLEKNFKLQGRDKIEIANEFNNFIYSQGMLNGDYLNAAHAIIDKALATPGLSKSDKAMFWDTKGEIYAAQGNKPKANECYRKTLAFNPNHYKDGPTALSTYISTGRYPN